MLLLLLLLQGIFELLNSCYAELEDPTSAHFQLCLSILETVCQVRGGCGEGVGLGWAGSEGFHGCRCSRSLVAGILASTMRSACRPGSEAALRVLRRVLSDRLRRTLRCDARPPPPERRSSALCSSWTCPTPRS